MDDIQKDSIFQNSLDYRSIFFSTSTKPNFFGSEEDEDFQVYFKKNMNNENINQEEEEKSDDKLGGGVSSSSLSSSNYDSKKSKKYLSKEERDKLRKMKNKESARKSRKKRKLEIEQLLQENRKLKKENSFLRHQLAISLCYECKKKFSQIIHNSSTRSEEPKKQLSQSSISFHALSKKKPITIFTTFVVILVIFTNFFSQTQILTNNDSLSKNSIRHLDSKNFHLSLEEIDNYNFTIAGWFITFGDFYMITHQSMFLDSSRYYFENKGGVRILKPEEALNYKNDTCKNCVVELGRNNLVRDKKSLRFTLILPNRKFWNDSLKNNIYYNSNTSTEEIFYEINCEVFGMKVNRMQAIVNQ